METRYKNQGIGGGGIGWCPIAPTARRIRTLRILPWTHRTESGTFTVSFGLCQLTNYANDNENEEHGDKGDDDPSGYHVVFRPLLLCNPEFLHFHLLKMTSPHRFRDVCFVVSRPATQRTP